MITYDISDDDRRTKVCETLKGWGAHIQYSVFWCVLSASGSARLKADLDALIHHDHDQVLFFCLGPERGRAVEWTDYLGRAFEPPVRGPIVI